MSTSPLLLVSGSQSGAVDFWYPAVGSKFSIKVHNKPVKSVAFSPDATLVASASLDGAIKISTTTSGELINTIPVVSLDPYDGLAAVVWLPDGKKLLACSQKAKIFVIDVNGINRITVLKGSALYQILDIAVSDDGRFFASGSAGGELRVWNASDFSLLHHTTTMGRGVVCSVAFYPDSSRLVAGCSDSAALVFDVSEDGKLDELFALRHAGLVDAVAVSPDSVTIATAGDSVFLWSAADCTLLRRVQCCVQDALVRFLSFSCDGRLLAGGTDNSITVWNVRSGEQMADLRNGDAAVRRCGVSVAFARG